MIDLIPPIIEEARPVGEAPDIRLRRLRMRSWRRGIREMDLVLGGFADGALDGLAGKELDAFEALLSENDHDIYQWIAGRVVPPDGHQEAVNRVRVFHRVY